MDGAELVAVWERLDMLDDVALDFDGGGVDFGAEYVDFGAENVDDDDITGAGRDGGGDGGGER